MAGRLDGKIAVITGAARGMGASHAELFAEEGAQVLLTDVRDGLGQQQAAQLNASGLAAEYIHLDVQRGADWEAALDYATNRFGLPTILVNNAGVTGSMKPVADETESEWARCIAVNQTGVFLGMKHVIPAMRKAGGGAIVNICSIWGVIGAPEGEGFIAYQASKGAVQLMTKNAAISLVSDNIRVNNICPGLVATPMMEEEGEESNVGVLALTPMNRVAQPKEVSYGVLYLASDEASYITGIELFIDGGYTAQ